MKTLGYVTGWILGGAVVVPLLYYLISLIFYAPNKVTETAINQYIADSTIIKIKMNPNPLIDRIKNDSTGGHIKTYIAFLSRHNKGNRDYGTNIFYCKEYGKYFSAIFLSERKFLWIDLNSYDKNVFLTINKKDFNNPKYGSLKNPVPVLKITGVDSSIRDDNKDFDNLYMDSTYRKNVKIYIEYLMPKKEFKERFGK
jgi:hypothetical protein